MKGKRKFISQEYSTEQGGKNLKEGSRRSRGATIFAASFFSFALVIGIVLISFTIVFFYAEVKGTSMQLTMNITATSWNEGTDSVIINRYARPKRGSIIVVRHYDVYGKYKENHIKRLIAEGGDWIHFRLVTDAPKAHYVIEVNGKDADVGRDFLNGNNVRNIHYDPLYAYQQGGNPDDIPASMQETDFDRRRLNNPGFRTHYKLNNELIPFLQRNEERDRYEFKLPNNFMFYMGDNRGGSGTAEEIDRMSIDCTYFGPQPYTRLAGVVSEVIHEKSAPQWFLDRLAWFFTFRWIK